MQFSTITTIELASKCNLACMYCINRRMYDANRIPGIMTTNIFKRSLEILQDLCKNGTQKEINLNGNGESTLDSNLIERIGAVKSIVGNRIVSFCTNGVNMTKELANQIKGSGLNSISLSPHSPFHARRAAHMMAEVGLNPLINFGVICASHNWAGQLEAENSVNCRLVNECIPLKEGRGYISSEGWVSPCCYDYKFLGAYGHVNNADILKQEVKPYSLCHTCHQKIDKKIQNQYEFIQ